MNYYFENHVQTHKHNPLNSFFLSNKPDNTSPNQKHFNTNTQQSIISKVNIIHPNPLLNNTNNTTTHYAHSKQLHIKPKNCNVETDSDTNTEEDNASFITSKNNIKNNILSLLKDKIFSPGDYQEQDDLLMMNSNCNDSEFNVSVFNSQINNLSTRTPPNVTSLSPLRSLSTSHHHKTLILDLDETLVHSTFHPIYRVPDIQLNIKFNNHNHSVYVFKRPYVDKFLYQMSKTFNIVIFTASIPEYANPLLDRLDTYNVISKRFFRGDCTEKNGLYVKELRKVGHNLEDMIIIDNNPISYSLNKENGFPIRTWHYDKNDNELKKIIPYLEYLSTVDDVRCVLNKVNIGGSIDEVYFDYLLEQKKNNCVVHNNGMNEYTKKESYMNTNNKQKNNCNQSMKVLNRCKSSSSFYQHNDNEHLKRVNKLKEEILNSINLIEHKGNQFSNNDVSVRDINTSTIKSRLKYLNNNNNNETNIKHYHHHLRRTNSSICVMIRPNSITKNNNDNNTHSIVNKPNYINFSHLSNSSNNNHNKHNESILNSSSINKSYCCDNKHNHNLQTPIHSYFLNNKSFNTSSKRRNIFKTPSMTSIPSFENEINNSYTKYKYCFESGMKNK